MLIVERHQKILNLLDEKQMISIEELKNTLPFSESTLRNDLRFLENKNQLKRAHGGAIKVVTNETAFNKRVSQNTKEKERIGGAAAKLIKTNETIFLDAGSTVIELAKQLPGNCEINIVTAALNTAITAGKNQNVSVNIVGGLLRPSLQELVGPKAIQGIKEVKADKVFLGASGLDLERGVTENHIFSAEVKKAMIESSKQIILLLDSNKIGKSYFADLIPLSKIDVLITGKTLSADVYEHLNKHQVKVILV